MSHETSPVIRLLESEEIPYRLLVHERPALTCESAAQERGVPLKEMVKCMVLLPKGASSTVVACLQGDKRLSMAKIKEALRIKSFSTPNPDDILRTTGFPVGSIPPFPLPDSILLVADSKLLMTHKVNISTGVPTAGVELSTRDFRRLFRGRFTDISE